MQRSRSVAERGFTLAALLVILSIMMIFVAYTVPKRWSTILQREREQQTIFIMRQYARAIYEFKRNHAGAMPTSMDQLREARQPRVMRWAKDPIDPLTGQVDWLIVPMGAAQNRPLPNPNQPNPTVAPPPTTSSGPSSTSSDTTDTTSTQGGAPQIQAFPMKDYAGGPFIGVRSPKTGRSYLVLNGADTYDQWVYTELDLEAEIQLRNQAMGIVNTGLPSPTTTPVK